MTAAEMGRMLVIGRRQALLGGTLGLVAAQAAAQVAPDPLAGEVIELWPHGAPGRPARPLIERVQEHGTAALRDRQMDRVARPRLVVFRPVKPNGAAAMIMPGGGYESLWFDKEGFEAARWLAARGVTAFVLLYRMPGEGWANRADVPLADAQRAMRLIRAAAARYGVEPTRVAGIGFSAGGHLCGDIATRSAAAVYMPVDAADRLSARPDLAAPIYPVVSMSAPLTHAGSRAHLLGEDASAAVEHAHDVAANVTAHTPPIFIAHAEDDEVVPVENALALRSALKAAKVPVETHLFARGGHGFGLRAPPGSPAAAWPELFWAWGKSLGWV